MRHAALFALGFVAITAFPLLGCKASVEGNVKTGGSDEVADFDKPIENRSANSVNPSELPKDVALLGARQDLSFRGPSTAACKCMEIALGQPGDRAFQWAGERPKTTRDAQLVFAMNSAGIACPGGGDNATGASYWGYEVVGNDVVVVVERAVPGRPVATGAILPRPSGNGQVYVRPADKDIPYGRPISGPGDRCQLGKLESTAAPAALPPPKKALKGDEPSVFSAESDVR